MIRAVDKASPNGEPSLVQSVHPETRQERLEKEIDRAAGAQNDASILRRVLTNFNTVFTVASAQEKKEPMRLLIRQITFNGPEKPFNDGTFLHR